MRHSLRRDIDADDLAGFGRQQKGTVALAARRIEHAQPARERRRDTVAVPVLVPDRAFLLGRKPLPGEREGGGGERGQDEREKVVRRDRRPCVNG